MSANPESLERASVDELRAVQLDRLKWAVRHAYENVQHYQRSFHAHGVHPDDLKTLDALSVHVECSPRIAALADLRDRAARELARDIKNNVGVSVSVCVHEPGAIERSVGKAKRVVDRRGA